MFLKINTLRNNGNNNRKVYILKVITFITKYHNIFLAHQLEWAWRRYQMRTENVWLNVREIFDRKGIPYHKHDVAQMRYLCKTFVEYMLEVQRRK